MQGKQITRLFLSWEQDKCLSNKVINVCMVGHDAFMCNALQNFQPIFHNIYKYEKVDIQVVCGHTSNLQDCFIPELKNMWNYSAMFYKIKYSTHIEVHTISHAQFIMDQTPATPTVMCARVWIWCLLYVCFNILYNLVRQHLAIINTYKALYKFKVGQENWRLFCLLYIVWGVVRFMAHSFVSPIDSLHTLLGLALCLWDTVGFVLEIF